MIKIDENGTLAGVPANEIPMKQYVSRVLKVSERLFNVFTTVVAHSIAFLENTVSSVAVRR